MQRMPALRLMLLLLSALPLMASASFDLGEAQFESLGDAETIPNNNVSALAQDSAGFIWIGTTDGLIRYDGYRFRYYGHEADDPDSIGGDFVRSLLVDRDGRIWVGSNADGLSVMDPASGRFQRLRHEPGNPHSLSDDTVRALAQTGDGRVYVGTREGLDYWDSATGQLHRWPQRLGGDSSMDDEHVAALLVDSQGTLWVGSWNGLSRLPAGANHFERVLGSATGLADQQIQCLTQIDDGRIGVGTARHGSYLLDPATLVLQRIPTGESSAPEGTQPAVLAMLQALPDQLWLGVFGGIDVVTLPSGELLRQIRPDPALPSGLAHDQIRAMLTDHAGQVWIGGYGGGLQRNDPRSDAIRMLRHSPSRSYSLSSPSISSVLELQDGLWWLGTRGNGIDIVDRNRGLIGGLRPQPGEQSALRSGVISALAQTGDGLIWAGTLDGLHRIDPGSGQIDHLGSEHGLPNSYIRRLLPGTHGQLWIGTDAGLALRKGDGRAIQAIPTVSGAALREDVNALVQEPGGRLWVGTSAGLYALEPGASGLQRVLQKPGSEDGLPHPGVLGLLLDREQTLWIDTPSGLARLRSYDGTHAQFDSVSHALGIAGRPFGANLLQDANGRIWTQNYVYDPQRNSVYELTRADGADLGTPWFRAYAQTHDGLLLFGGGKGLLAIDPLRFTPWQLQAPLVATELRIDGQVQAGAIPAAGIVLRPQQRSFSIEFAALDYTAPQRNRYAYRLLGFDRDWIATDASQRVASYNSLPPGGYALEVRGSNRGGVLADNTLSIPIRVLPAWWQTVWFAVVAAVAGMIGLYLLVHGYQRRIRRREAQLQAMVAARTAELSLAKDEAERALAQWQVAQSELLAREKMASLGQLVAGVAHEINTPVGVALTAASFLGERSAHLRSLVSSGGLSKSELDSYLDQAHEAAAMIGNNLSRASNLVRSFKQVSVDRSSDDRRRFNLHECLRSVVASLELTWKRRPITLELRCPLEIELDSYPGSLGQVITNLIQNALLHAYPEGTSGTMRIHVSSHPGDHQVRLMFCDDGIGIGSADLAQIFEPFFTTRRSQGGSGLGLHIAYNLVTARLGGQISASGSPGAGMRFDLLIPLRAPED